MAYFCGPPCMLHVDISLIFWLFKPEYPARLVLMNLELSWQLHIHVSELKVLAFLCQIWRSDPISIFSTFLGTQLWQESRASCVVISRRCWTSPHALLLDFDAQTTSLPRSLTFTGCVHLNVSGLSWRPWSTGHCTAWRYVTFLMTYAVSRTYPADETCGQHLRASWKYREPVSRLSVIKLSALPDLDYGTFCRAISLNAKLLKLLNENLNTFSLVYHLLDSSCHFFGL